MSSWSQLKEKGTTTQVVVVGDVVVVREEGLVGLVGLVAMHQAMLQPHLFKILVSSQP